MCDILYIIFLAQRSFSVAHLHPLYVVFCNISVAPSVDLVHPFPSACFSASVALLVGIYRAFCEASVGRLQDIPWSICRHLGLLCSLLWEIIWCLL